MRAFAALLGLSLWLAMIACGQDVRPDIVLITLDTTRSDALGCYGNPGGHTPNIDALCDHSTVFDNAVAPIGTTFPSHASIFTGLPPRAHGVRSNADILAAPFETLAERLAASGYETAAWVSMPSMLSRGGLHQGFEHLSDAVTGRPGANPRPGNQANSMLRAWLSEPRERPYFAWLHYFEPHTPLRKTEYAAEMTRGYGGVLAEGVPIMLFYSLGKQVPWDDADRRALRFFYDGEIRQVDRLVGEALRTIDASPRAERTIVILTADHGQSLGERGHVGHAASLDEEVLHVPLIVHDPRRPVGRRIASRVGLVDLAATIEELAGLPPRTAPEHIGAGRSIAAALAGEELPGRAYYAEVERRALFATHDQSEVAVYRGPAKVTLGESDTRAFDLATDPDGAEPQPADGELLELARGFRAIPLRKSETLADPEVEAELRALGYLE